FANLRLEPDDRHFEDPIPSLILTDPIAAIPQKKSPVSAETFKKYSGGSGYGKFDYDLRKEGLEALKEKFGAMSPEVKLWRHMAIYGSLPPGGAIALDEEDNPLGFADPVTGKMGKDPFEKLPQVLNAMDNIFGVFREKGWQYIGVFTAHDSADGMTKKEKRIEGEHPRLFTSAKKFSKFLELQRPVIKHMCKNWRDVVFAVEFINEPLNMDLANVPIPYIQRRIHEFNCLIHEIDPTMHVSVGMRDYNSWKYFAHMSLPEFKDGDKIIKNPYYKQFFPQSHYYFDKEDVTPLDTNVGKFFMPEKYVLGWLMGEVDPRTPEEYKPALGIVETMKTIFNNGYLGVLFWIDRPGEFWPKWKDYTHFIRNILPKRAPFATPLCGEKEEQQVHPQSQQKKELLTIMPKTLKALEDKRFAYTMTSIFTGSIDVPITFDMLTQGNAYSKLIKAGLTEDTAYFLVLLARTTQEKGLDLSHDTLIDTFEEIKTLYINEIAILQKQKPSKLSRLKALFKPGTKGIITSIMAMLILVPAIVSAEEGFKSAAKTPILTVIWRFLSNPLGAGIIVMITVFTILLIIDRFSSMSQEYQPADMTGRSRRFGLTRKEFLMGMIAGGITFFAGHVFEKGKIFLKGKNSLQKKDSLLGAFTLSAGDVSVKELDADSMSKLFAAGSEGLIFTNDGVFLGAYYLISVKEIMNESTKKIIGYMPYSSNGLIPDQIFNKSNAKVCSVNKNGAIRNLNNVFIGRVDNFDNPEFLYNTEGEVIARCKSIKSMLCDIYEKNTIVTEVNASGMFNRERTIYKFFYELPDSVRKKIVTTIEKNKDYFQSFVFDVVLTLREWHLRQTNPLTKDELKSFLNVESFSTVLLAEILFAPELFGDLFELVFDEIKKRAQKSSKPLIDFLKEDAKLVKDTDIVKFAGIVALFGKFGVITRNHPEFISVLISRIFRSVK
ncbi:MAG: hypothetical protein KJ864_05980, partial [Candidatus Omnitrophica bacterium]|nr:hypothetical protein [Candidatus Omnitrophota bacterium]